MYRGRPDRPCGTRHAGFTLIELMVVLVIGAILVTVAAAGYSYEIRKSRRTEARTALMDLAGREEAYNSTMNTYTTTPANVGYPGGLPLTVGTGYYQVNICSPACAPSVAPAPSFSITATPIGVQTSDTQCASFSVDSTGQQYAADAGGTDQTQACWQR